MELYGYLIIDENKKQKEVEAQKQIFKTQLDEKITELYNKYKKTDNENYDVVEKRFSPEDNKFKNNILNNFRNYNIKIHQNKIAVYGKQLTEPNIYLLSLTYVCIINQDATATTERATTKYIDKISKKEMAVEFEVEGSNFDYVASTGDTTYTYEHYINMSLGIKVKTNDNLDILEAEPIKLLDTSGALIYSTKDFLVGSSIVNIAEVNDYKYEDIKNVVDTGLNEIKKVVLPDLNWDNMFRRNNGNYADVYLNSNFSKITDGKIENETTTQSTGIKETKQVWKGNYPLDRLIYTIQSNLDILMANRKINGDAYGNLYATLLVQAIQSATILEQARIQAYEQASQFQIKSMIEYYLGAITAKLNVIKTLAEVSSLFLDKSLKKAQIKLYDIQSNGFKANNINKLFTTQFEGASTAFTSGMLDAPPAPLNDADLMSLYTRVGSDMNII